MLNKTTILFFLVILTGCNSEYANLENSYKANPELHKELSDCLVEFSNKYKTHVTLSKRIDGRTSFSIFLNSDVTNYPVIFDSALTRNDPYPNKTQLFEIPIKTIIFFNKLPYTRIRSDSSGTFFGGPWHVKFQIGTQADIQYGILISDQMNSCEECFKKLESNTWLTEGTIP